MSEQTIPAEELKRIETEGKEFEKEYTKYGRKDCYYSHREVRDAYEEGRKAEYLRSLEREKQAAKDRRWAKERINYLIDQERRAIIHLDTLPIGSHIRHAQWWLIKELGFRKNELQDLLRKREAEEGPPAGDDGLEREKKAALAFFRWRDRMIYHNYAAGCEMWRDNEEPVIDDEDQLYDIFLQSQNK